MKSDHRDEGNHQFKSTINFVVCLSSTAFCLELRIVFTCQIIKQIHKDQINTSSFSVSLGSVKKLTSETCT